MYSRLYHLNGQQNENQRKRKERQELWSCQRTKKAVEDEGDGDANCNWHTWIGVSEVQKESWKSGKLEDESGLFKLHHY